VKLVRVGSLTLTVPLAAFLSLNSRRQGVGRSTASAIFSTVRSDAPFPDGQSALNLAAARLRYIAGTAWSIKRYLNIEMLKDQQMRGAITA
jgi:hypothetical protein